MKHQLAIAGLCLLAVAVGAWLYFGRDTRPLEKGGIGSAPAQEIAFSVLDEGSTASITERKNYAIYDAGEFSTFWKKAHPTRGNPPKIDFTTSYVIGVFAGTEPTTGYKIAIERIRDRGATREVAVTIAGPGEGCTPKHATSTPYQFVVVPFGNADTLTHTDVEAKTACK